MTYDYFGTGWAEKIGHHTNLKKYPASTYSCEAAIDYLINTLAVKPSQIYLGYACYGRSASGANLENLSYKKDGQALGTFENGAPEFPDILNNYLDLENGKSTGKNGFTLKTDEVADADYLYNNKTKAFISIETPRTAKEKGKYIIAKGLGGGFGWTGDQDNGLIANAVREGMGYEIEEKNFDMSKIYNPGETGNLK